MCSNPSILIFTQLTQTTTFAHCLAIPWPVLPLRSNRYAIITREPNTKVSITIQNQTKTVRIIAVECLCNRHFMRLLRRSSPRNDKLSSPNCHCERSEAISSHKSSYRSFHPGFMLFTKSSFFALEPPLICFSLKMALSISEVTS